MICLSLFIKSSSIRSLNPKRSNLPRSMFVPKELTPPLINRLKICCCHKCCITLYTKKIQYIHIIALIKCPIVFVLVFSHLICIKVYSTSLLNIFTNYSISPKLVFWWWGECCSAHQLKSFTSLKLGWTPVTVKSIINTLRFTSGLFN